MTAAAALAFSGPAAADNYGGNTRAEQQRMTRIIYNRFGTGWLGRTMVCIARAESGLNPRAVNWRDNVSVGLFQIHYPSWRRIVGPNYRVLYDPVVNASIAYRVYRASGLGAWTTRGRC